VVHHVALTRLAVDELGTTARAEAPIFACAPAEPDSHDGPIAVAVLDYGELRNRHHPRGLCVIRRRMDPCLQHRICM